MENLKKGFNCIKKALVHLFNVCANACADFLTHCPKVARFFIALFVIVLGLTSGTYVYAKYYSLSAKEGIAIATGVYFTSNYAHDADGEFVESLVNIGYKGGDASFTLEVYNYENNLLFNTDNVNIPYTIELWLESAPTDGAEYSVSVGEGVNDTKQVLGADAGSPIRIEDQSIAGGSARENSYSISLSAPQDHTAIPIYVRIQTLEGSLINRTLTGKMLLSGSAKTESKIESKGFVIPKEPAELSEFERLNTLSAFTYEVLTVGSVASSGATEELKISWNPSVLSIDLFDEAYLKWLEEAKKEDPNVSGPAYDTETGRNYIIIDIMPYSAENIGFFRGPQYNELATDLEALKNYIDADKIVTIS